MAFANPSCGGQSTMCSLTSSGFPASSRRIVAKLSSFRVFPFPSNSSPHFRRRCRTRTLTSQRKRDGHFGVWACSQVDAASASPFSKSLSNFSDSCWRFLRPHTIRGTTLGSLALVVRALIENPGLIDWWLTFKALYGLVALICGNGYIVGINQIYDIGIDKVNKPYLPIAAGDLSVQSAWLLVIGFAASGLLIVACNFGPFISSLYCLGLFLGTIYSVPPFRLKRYPVAAFLIIAMVRGFLLNFGVYYATRAALGLSFKWSFCDIICTGYCYYQRSPRR